MGRNTVKKPILVDGVTVLVGPGRRVINILAQRWAARMARNVTTSVAAGAGSSDRVVNDHEPGAGSPDGVVNDPRTNEPGAGSSDRIVIDLQTNEPVVTGQSPATVVDECLTVVDGLPSARRKNPTAAILPQVDMTTAIVHQRSMLSTRNTRASG